MNKFSLSLFVTMILISVLAKAGAQVGDWAEFETRTLVRETGERKWIHTRETVLEVKRDDYIIWFEEIVNGVSVVAEERFKSRLMSVKDGAEFVRSCDYIGVIADIQVPAGTFKTCKVTDRELVIWFGAVPFGKVRLAYTLQSQNESGFTTTDGVKDLIRFGHK